jgi:transposase-like protein
MGKRRYSDEERGVALAALAANNGDVSKTARQLDIPYMTLANWAKGRCHPAVTEIGEQKKQEMGDLVEDTLRKVLEGIPEKVKEADLKDTTISAGILADKMQLLRGKPTSVVKADETVTARVNRYEEALRRAAEAEGGAAGDGAGEPVDTAEGPGQSDGPPGRVPEP